MVPDFADAHPGYLLSPCPGRGAAPPGLRFAQPEGRLRDALQNRDLHKRMRLRGPASAAQRFALHRVRDTKTRFPVLASE